MTQLMQNFWETAYKQNIGKMLGICYRYVRDKQVAEDLTHDAFLNAIDKSSSFEGRGHFDAWLRKIVVNEALKYLRDRKQKEAHEEWLQYESEMMQLNEEGLIADFTQEELLNAINQLPEHHKLVFNLFVIDQFSHAEIAQQLGISEGTSKSHLARARKKIRSLLIEKEEKKRALLPFLLSIKLWSIDTTYRKAFRDFEIEPSNPLEIDIQNPDYLLVPKFSSSYFISGNYAHMSIIIGAVAASLLLGVIIWKPEANSIGDKTLANNTSPTEQIKGVETRFVNASQTDIFEDTSIKQKVNFQNTDSTSATITNNSIMYHENNLNDTEMKKLSILGTMMLAGASMGFDSSKAVDTRFNAGLKLPDIQFQGVQDGMIIERKEGNGTFTASKVIWSSKNHHVYMKGTGMKGNFEKDKFNATGTISFLGEVYYLLIDGEEALFDRDIKLSDGEYSIKSLSIQQATKKYGDRGKNGAVEIAKL